MSQYLLLTGGITGFITAFFLTNIVTKTSNINNIVDKPRADRFHTKTTALLGGVAVNFSFLLTLFFFEAIPMVWLISLICCLFVNVFFLFKRKAIEFVLSAVFTICLSLIMLWFMDGIFPEKKFLWLIATSQIIFLVGAFDDAIKPVFASSKFAFQLLAALLLSLEIDPLDFIPSPFNHVFTIFWIVGISNAFNLIDNMNGLSSGVAAISAICFSIFNFYTGQVFLGSLALMLAAVLFGFIPHNYPKAKIFMGDSGSLLLGFLLAGFSLFGSWENLTTFDVAALLPICVLAYPIFDVAFVSITRTKEGRPVYIGGKDHTSHLLVKTGLRPWVAVFCIYILASITGSIALLLANLSLPYAITTMFIVVTFLSAFGYTLRKIVQVSQRKVKLRQIRAERKQRMRAEATGTF
ncbi:MraY family glycosyltransferase [Flammeovirgaceae bacterium SG7u.111]|nr:MraY family glycosyltransferase [Flammeovirgaceae bacterium SG7u.132]WPO35467.1 MraY family glycosyltransferase [Flammeovirgaceae bacterium SG7u.111]